MSIKELTFHGLRNLAPTTLQPSPRINVLHGDNGSGKTSVLEGIHVLGMGRSFRTRQLKHAIQTDAPYMTLHGRLAGDPEVTLGVRRLRTQRELELRLRGRRGALGRARGGDASTAHQSRCLQAAGGLSCRA